MKMKDHDDPDVFIGKYLDIVSSLKDGGHHLPEDDQNSWDTWQIATKLLNISWHPAPHAAGISEGPAEPTSHWFNNKRHSSNQREKALTSFAKEKKQHERQNGDVTCWFCGKKGHRKSQCKDRLEKSDSWIKNQSMLRLHDAPMHAWREENKRIPRRKHQRTEWGVITPSLLATWLKIEQIWSPKSPNGRNLSVLHLCAPRIFETGATSLLI